MDELDSESIEYSTPKRLKKLTANDLMSDVKFIVGRGNEKVEISGHQLILSMGSPVFFKMFYGDFKSNRIEPINLEHLEPVAFMNLIKYIYGSELEIEIKDIASTCIACDQYLLHRFPQAIAKFIASKVNYSNCFLILDQLTKLRPIDGLFECLPFNFIKKICEITPQLDFNYFQECGLNSVQEILKLNLSIPEIVLLRACTFWVDVYLKKQDLETTVENRRNAFSPFKSLICFNSINLGQIQSLKNIKNYLSPDEIVDFLILQPSDSKGIDYKKKRSAPLRREVSFIQTKSRPNVSSCIFSLASKSPFIITELLVAFREFKDLTIYKGDRKLDLKWTFRSSVLYSSLSACDLFILQPNVYYRFSLESTDKFTSLYEKFKDDINFVAVSSHCCYGFKGFALDDVKK